MEFKAAKCPQCGGDMQVPDDRDIIKCMYCGVDVVVREAIVLYSGESKNYMGLADAALNAGNYQESFTYYTKALEVESKNSEAWKGKGTSAGWQSNLVSDRFKEMLECYKIGIECCESDAKKELMRMEIAITIISIASAYFNLSTNHVLQFISLDQAKYEHVDRCKRVVTACDAALNYDPTFESGATLLVDVCNRMLKLTEADAEEKSFFRRMKEKHEAKISFKPKTKSKDALDAEGYFCLIIGFSLTYLLLKYVVGMQSILWIVISTFFGGTFMSMLVVFIFLSMKGKTKTKLNN